MEEALEENRTTFTAAEAGDWPPEHAATLAQLALQCAEERRRRRPALTEVLPKLEALYETALATQVSRSASVVVASAAAAPRLSLHPSLAPFQHAQRPTLMRRRRRRRRRRARRSRQSRRTQCAWCAWTCRTRTRSCRADIAACARSARSRSCTPPPSARSAARMSRRPSRSSDLVRRFSQPSRAARLRRGPATGRRWVA